MPFTQYNGLNGYLGFLQVREAQLAQYNYILVVGEEEANTEQVSTLIMTLFVPLLVFYFKRRKLSN